MFSVLKSFFRKRKAENQITKFKAILLKLIDTKELLKGDYKNLAKFRATEKAILLKYAICEPDLCESDKNKITEMIKAIYDK